MTETITNRIKELHNSDKTSEQIAIVLNKDVHYIRSVISRLKKRNELKTTIKKSDDHTKKDSEIKDYTTDIKSLIPTDNNFIETDDIKNIISCHNSNRLKNNCERINFLLIGETGTGKSEMGRYIAYKLKLPLWEYTFNGETSTDNLLGYKDLIPTSDNKIITKWIDGIIPKAFRYGGVLLLNEINTISPNVIIKLFTAFEKSRYIKLDDNDGEIIKAHKDLLIIATMNEGINYNGTNDLNIALLNRFVKIELKYNQIVERRLIKNGLIINNEWLEIANKQREQYYKGEFKTPISTRDLIILTDLINILGEKKAIKYFLNNFRDQIERETIKELIKLELKNVGDTTKDNLKSDDVINKDEDC